MADLKKLSHNLACADEATREAGLCSAEELVKTQTLSLVDSLKLWKALFYCSRYSGFWMRDDYEKQHQLAERLAKTVKLVKDRWVWAHACLEVLREEWDGIDKWRIDKYMYLVRVFVRRLVKYAAKVLLTQKPKKWQKLMDGFLARSVAKGLALTFHIADVLLDETQGNYEHKLRVAMPFITFMRSTRLNHVAEKIAKQILWKLADCADDQFASFLFSLATSK